MTMTPSTALGNDLLPFRRRQGLSAVMMSRWPKTIPRINVVTANAFAAGTPDLTVI
ncbi:MAG: hypothetical protein R3F54_14380 [Alphaproteobacteria bacterium]